MIFDVIWRPRAEKALAQLWLAAADRQAITIAAHSIDQQLRRDPNSIGESRTGATRILIVEPLAVLYEVIDDDRRAFVLSTWLV